AARDTAGAAGAARDAAGADTQTAAQSPVQAAARPGDRAAPVAVAQDADDALADASGRPLATAATMATAATTGSAAEAQRSAADSR
ncbi:hypothetical protein GTZ89_14755, partial [Streptomyces sp. SID8382]|nr:hypothetical protein [Streptomyces sp. SID8382]